MKADWGEKTPFFSLMVKIDLLFTFKDNRKRISSSMYQVILSTLQFVWERYDFSALGVHVHCNWAEKFNNYCTAGSDAVRFHKSVSKAHVTALEIRTYIFTKMLSL